MTTYDCYAIFNRKFASSYDSRNGVAVPYDHEADTFNTRDETLLEPAANRTAAPVAVSASGDRIYIHAEATTTRGYVQALNTSDGSVEKKFPVDHETVYNAYGNLCVAEQGAALYATYGPGCLYRIDISGEKWTAARVPNTDAPWGGLQDIAASPPGRTSSCRWTSTGSPRDSTTTTSARLT